MTQTRTVPELVSEWTEELANRLNSNYRRYTVKSLETFTSDYAQQRLKRIKSGAEKLTKFVIREGRKYYKINQAEWRDGEYKDTSVHCFVDKKTGQVYKPAGWQKPAKHVRYDLSNPSDRERLLVEKKCSWSGGYLYLR